MTTSYDLLAPKTSTSSLSPVSPPTPLWDDNPVHLKDFASKRQVPGFARIVKGNFMTLGSSKFSLSKQHQEVFVHSVKVGVKVLAHCLRRVEAVTVPRRGQSHATNARLFSIDQRLAVPISYQGWFELLSEDCKSARPITSVHELSKVKPERVLVRENIKGYIVDDDTKPSFDKTKIVIAGEQLRLSGEMSLPSSIENRKVKLLRCIDSCGAYVYLSFDQRGVFTVIAGEKDVTGVFNIRDIVQRFRLPLTVKLVQGVRPRVDQSRFTGFIRLDWVYTDETAFVCPIEKNHVRLLPVPSDAGLQLVAATNQAAMSSTELHATMMAKCSRMINNYNNTLHLIVQIPEAAAKNKNRQNNMFSASLTSQTEEASLSSKSRQREKRLMDEIDDLYDYVRDGGAVPNGIKFSYDSDEESYWEEPAYEPLDEFQARLRALEAGEKVNYPDKYKPTEPSEAIAENPQSEGSAAGNSDVKHKSDVIHKTVWTNGQTSDATNSSSTSSSVPPELPPKRPDLLPREAFLPSGLTNADISSSAPPPGVSPENQAMKPSEQVIYPYAEPIGGLGSSPRRKSEDVSSPVLYTGVNGVTTVSNFGLVSSSRTSLLTVSDLQSGKKPQSLNRTSSQPLHNQKTTQLTYKIIHTSKSSSDVRPKLGGFFQSQSKSSVESNSCISGDSGRSSNDQRRHLARDFKDSDISSIGPGGSSAGSSDQERKPTSNARRKMQTVYL